MPIPTFLPESTLRNLLALWRAPEIGSQRCRQLIEKYPDLDEVFAKPRQIAGLPAASLAYFDQPNWAQVDADLAWLAADDQHLIYRNDHRYPSLLKETRGAPLLLFVKGDASLLADPQLGMVGSRNPTPGGKETAFEFAKYLAASGFVITSGLALGVDAAAHQGALQAQGKTIAVLGTGVDRVYPARNRALAQQIAEQGALVSEFPLGTNSRAEHFPMRNRIISGLSLGTLVVEAALRSGSLITARTATEQGREVFAIPGSIHNPLAKGCHQLIRQGAKLVDSATDIIEELGPLLNSVLQTPSFDATETTSAADPEQNLDKDYQQLLDAIGFEATPIDVMLARTDFKAETVASMLLMLELQGLVAQTNGGYQRLA